ncbi:MAG TPA: hypothetical protein VN753_10505 [Terracidiphilus sp.]|nr:hypothetical protein [Terracidiphilus sp.]
MTARIAFYFAAVVALVLFLAAAVPSHATQHREPALAPEYTPKPASASVPKPTAPVVHSDSLPAKVRSAPRATRKKSPESHKSGSKSGR